VSDFTVSPTDADSTRESAPTDSYSDTNTTDRLPALDARLTALERAVTDGESDLQTLADTATADARLDELEARTSEIETRLDELDAAVQALRGYAGGVRAVNREVERRADAALSAVDRLDDSDEVELDLPDSTDSGDVPTDSPTDTDHTAEHRPADETVENTPDGGDRSDFADRVRDLL
jgi:uncharacterized coiled-coil protein SlyX